MRKIKGKNAAIELSMTTIIVVTLSLVLLILGFFLIRNIMCGAIGFSDTLNKNTENEIQRIFATTQAELVCFGGGQEPAYIAPGEESFLWCKINAKETATYTITLDSLTPLDPRSQYASLVNRWLLQNRWESEIKPNDDTPHKIGVIKVNEDAPEIKIRAKLTVKKRLPGVSGSGGDTVTGSKDIDLVVKNKGTFRTAFC